MCKVGREFAQVLLLGALPRPAAPCRAASLSFASHRSRWCGVAWCGVGKHNSYKISADSEEEMQAWIKSISAAMTEDPIYKMFLRRKEHATRT